MGLLWPQISSFATIIPSWYNRVTIQLCFAVFMYIRDKTIYMSGLKDGPIVEGV